MALESSLKLRTGIPWRRATLVRLMSLVRSWAPMRRARWASLVSTDFASMGSSLWMVTSRRGFDLSLSRQSRPRWPRSLLIGSWESARRWSSSRTNWGTMRVPPRNPVSQMPGMRPSMMTLVSTRSGLVDGGLAAEADVGDDEGELVAVGAQGEGDADEGEGHVDDEFDEVDGGRRSVRGRGGRGCRRCRCG